MDQINVKVIIGSTRQGRFGDKPASWIYQEIGKVEGVSAELLDLREYNMPFFDEPTSPHQSKGKYSNPTVQKWSDKIREADAFIVITPEYNHGYPGVLKNAMDVLYDEWNHKPIGFLSYGSVGGARAIEQLRQVVIELQMTPIRFDLHVPHDVYMKAATETIPVNTETFAPMRKSHRGDPLELFINELLWHARPLKTARHADTKK